MKLKRFLLRYEPPGIGLEVEEGGECEVRHKNLPPAVDVSSSKDIGLLVDELIAGEPGMLTRRRHRPALLQLLGRLYQIDVEPTDDEAEPSARLTHRDGRGAEGRGEREEVAPKAGASGASPGDGSALQEGQLVVLIGLTGKLQVCNGETGTLTKVRPDKQKYEVMLASAKAPEPGEPLKIRGEEHIVPLAPKGTPLVVGTHVVIRGLRNHIELNGCLGRVVESHEESHRFEVRASESGQLFRVKQENLLAIESVAHISMPQKENREPNTGTTPRRRDAPGTSAGADVSASLGGDGPEEVFEAGSTVVLVGLKTATVYNGQTAEVLSVDRMRSRYEIRLKDGSVKTIRSENVRLVAGPQQLSQQQTPRSRRPKEPGVSSSSGQTSDRNRERDRDRGRPMPMP